MNKAQKVVVGFFVAAVIVVTALFVFYLIKTSGINIPEGIVFYYGETCPHCKIIEEFIAENNITSRINFSSKEIFNNPINLAEFKKVIEKCQILPENAGVPLIYNGQEEKCYSGQEEGISFFKNKLNISS